LKQSKKLVICCVIAPFIALSAGCKKTPADPAKQGADAPTVIAEFDGGKLTAEDLNYAIPHLAPMVQQQLQDPAQKEQLVSKVAEFMALASAAREKGYDKDPETKAMIDFYINQILAQTYFTKEIEPQVAKVAVSDEEVKKYYDENKAEFSSGKMKARHILVDTEEEARALHAKVVAAPDTFSTVAKEKSKCPSSANGGNLDWFDRGQMAPEFESVAFALNKGQISEPFQSRFGWHIVIADDKTEVDATPFEEVKEGIKQKMLAEKKEKISEDTVEALKKQKNFVLHKDKLDKVGVQKTPEVPPMPPAPPAGQ